MFHIRAVKYFVLFFVFAGTAVMAQTGIGTVNPVSKLQVETVLADPATSGTSANGNLRLSGTTGNHVLDFGLSSSATYSWLQSRNRTNYGSRFALSLNPTGGNVGIGNTAPGTTLEIGSADGTIPGQLILNPVTPGAGVEGGEIMFRPAPLSLSPAAQGWTLDQTSVASVPRFRIFPANSGESNGITIRDNGYIGLGWANPSYKLHVYTTDATSFYLESTTADNNGMFILNANTASNWANNWHELIIFQRQGTRIGAIEGSNSGNNVSYSTTSDYRLKTDLKDYAGLDLVNQIKTYDYAWKNGGGRMYGVMAHELQRVLPYAVSGEKDAVDKDGKILPQGVDYSKLTPILVKAIQEQDLQLKEQQKLIQALMQRLELLESKN